MELFGSRHVVIVGSPPAELRLRARGKTGCSTSDRKQRIVVKQTRVGPVLLQLSLYWLAPPQIQVVKQFNKSSSVSFGAGRRGLPV